MVDEIEFDHGSVGDRRSKSDDLPPFDWRQMTPEDSPKSPPDLYRDPLVTDLRTPKVAVGDDAFDFELPVYDFSSGAKTATGTTFHLADAARQRPVALVFGSYT